MKYHVSLENNKDGVSYSNNLGNEACSLLYDSGVCDVYNDVFLPENLRNYIFGKSDVEIAKLFSPLEMYLYSMSDSPESLPSIKKYSSPFEFFNDNDFIIVNSRGKIIASLEVLIGTKREDNTTKIYFCFSEEEIKIISSNSFERAQLLFIGGRNDDLEFYCVEMSEKSPIAKEMVMYST